ncbi:MAG: RNA polymerase sigma factor [Acidobacteriota bacterium]
MQQAESDQVRRAARGDRTAFAALAGAHWPGLVGLARSVVGEAAAEDVVQDALIVAWRKLGSLRDPTAFSAWLTRIVLNQCLRRKRRWRDWLPIGAVAEPAFEASPQAELDLERCLNCLAPRQRAVMYMTIVEGRTDSEIAALMRITKASVRSHRRRARQRLNQLLNGANHVS